MGTTEIVTPQVDLRELKPIGSYPGVEEKLVRELSREIHRKNSSDIAVSWEAQEEAMDYYNSHGFVDTLNLMIEMRKQNEINELKKSGGRGPYLVADDETILRFEIYSPTQIKLETGEILDKCPENDARMYATIEGAIRHMEKHARKGFESKTSE